MLATEAISSLALSQMMFRLRVNYDDGLVFSAVASESLKLFIGAPPIVGRVMVLKISKQILSLVD